MPLVPVLRRQRRRQVDPYEFQGNHGSKPSQIKKKGGGGDTDVNAEILLVICISLVTSLFVKHLKETI